MESKRAQHNGAWLKKLGSSQTGDHALVIRFAAIISVRTAFLQDRNRLCLAQRKGRVRVKLQGSLLTSLESQLLYFNYKLM